MGYEKIMIKKYSLLTVIAFSSLASNAYSVPVVKILNATSQDPYTTIKSVFGATAIGNDVADGCSHLGMGSPEDQKHIKKIYDSTLKKWVFQIVSHWDDEDCVTHTLQKARTEIKVDKSSPLVVKSQGEETTWSFLLKLDDGFTATDSFTHLFQAKAENDNGDQFDPRIRLSLYNRNDKLTLELNGSDDDNGFKKLTSVDATPLIGKWVQVILKAKWSDQGTMEFFLRNQADGKNIKYYKNTNIDLWDQDWGYMRFKAGIYREYKENLMTNVSARFSNIRLEKK